ncbi:MAG: nitroreductase family protein [Chloroflexi bacterium]|nr:nitroreductase family protein [Chloroflexota bacterium]
MNMTHDLSPDELLTTTRAVRRRMDFDRPIADEVIRECLAVAQQAPTATNQQNWHFMIVTDADQRLAIADLYRQGWEEYRWIPTATLNRTHDDAGRAAVQRRVRDSAQYLVDNMHRVPAMVIPCVVGRADDMAAWEKTTQWSTMMFATWSLMLAARARGIGSVYTCVHLVREEEAAGVLGIPYDRVMQVGLIPLGYTIGDRFRPAHREPLEDIVHWNRW